MNLMDSNFIEPMKRVNFLNNEKLSIDRGVKKEDKDFKNIFSQAVQDVIDTDRDYENKQYQLATGQIDNAADVTIAGAKAQLAVELLVQLRNSALNAYNEIIRINV